MTSLLRGLKLGSDSSCLKLLFWGWKLQSRRLCLIQERHADVVPHRKVVHLLRAAERASRL